MGLSGLSLGLGLVPKTPYAPLSAGSAKKRPALPKRDGELKQLAKEAKAGTLLELQGLGLRVQHRKPKHSRVKQLYIKRKMPSRPLGLTSSSRQ